MDRGSYLLLGILQIALLYEHEFIVFHPSETYNHFTANYPVASSLVQHPGWIFCYTRVLVFGYLLMSSESRITVQVKRVVIHFCSRFLKALFQSSSDVCTETTVNRMNKQTA
ncbi:hypothetical protein F4678DRAFT_116422 [Xylaria arbuscula]|nr:hypothetical protein F4678DRAFT_116422 [Xylaria arbuscula]